MENLSIFDLDHTLICKNVSFSFGKYLYFKGLMSPGVCLRLLTAYGAHKVFGKSLKWLHQQVFDSFFKSLSKESLTLEANDFLDRYLNQLYYLPVLHCLHQAKNEGRKVALFSSSPDLLVELIAKRLGISLWIGTCYGVDKKGFFSQIVRIVDGPFKAEFLSRLMERFNISEAAVTVYTDSILDLPLLEMAGTKVAVNPDRKLLKMSRQQKWQVI